MRVVLWLTVICYVDGIHSLDPRNGLTPIIGDELPVDYFIVVELYFIFVIVLVAIC